MNTRFAKGRALSLLLVFAMLIVSFATLLPITASADGEIQDFSFQTLSSANPNDAQTDLRFLFTIGNLDYDAVGFVFSTSNATPVAGTDATYSTTNAYSAITANSEPIAAPTGRWWVAVALSDIDLANFETNIYVRPYVKTGEVYTYGATASIDVCTALTVDKVAAGESNIYDSSALAGAYTVDGNHILIRKAASAISGDGKTFHPSSTDPDGNDLWFEYSFFWNGSLTNWDRCRSEMMVCGFRNSSTTRYRDFYYLYTRNNEYHKKNNPTGYFTSTDCPYMGHFDYSTYLNGCSPDQNCAEDLTSEGNYLFGDLVGRYAAGWVGGRGDSPYIYDDTWTTKGGEGWHRLGVRYHQDVEVDNGKGGIVYSGYTELYINGVKVWKVQTDMQGYWQNSQWKHASNYGEKPGNADLKDGNLLLWEAKETATEDEIAAGWTLYNGLYYKDNADLQVQARVDQVGLSESGTVYVGFADICWTCGDGFAHPVSAASLNADKTINLGGNDYAAKIWYVYDN